MDTFHNSDPSPTPSGQNNPSPRLRIAPDPKTGKQPTLNGLEPIIPDVHALHDIPRLFFQWAETNGDAVFLRVHRSNGRKDGWEDFSFRRLRDEAAKIAAGLWGLGIRRGDRVVIAAENSPEWVIALLGILQIGAIVVPIDPKLTPQEMENLFAGCEPSVIFGSRSARSRLEEAAPGLHFGNRILDLEPETISLWNGASPAPDVALRPDEPALIVYTSGTTGNPKGVVLTHDNLVASGQCTAAEVPMWPEDRVLFVLPLFHIYCLSTLMTAASVGCHVVLQTQLKGPEIVGALKENQCTVIGVVPRLLELLQKGLTDKIEAESPWTRRMFRTSLSLSRRLKPVFGEWAGRLLFSKIQDAFGGSLRSIISGGGRLDPDTSLFFETLGFSIQEGYGLSETTGCVTVNRMDSRKAGSVGKILSINGLKVDAPGPDGIGEILIQGPTVFKGYYKNPDLNAECFTDEWFRTGDLGMIDSQGRLVLTGRKKDVIVLSSGKNVYPDEVEAAYIGSPLIKQIGVIGANRGRGEEVVAAVVPNLDGFSEDDRKDRDRLTAALKAEIGRISLTLSAHKRPTRMEVFFEDLPATLIGKVKRHELKKKLEEKDRPLPSKTESDTGAVIAKDPLAARVDAVIRKFLGDRAPTTMTAATHLELDLGMDSLARTELVAALEQAFRVSVPDDEIVHVQTVGGVLGVLRRHTDTSSLAQTAPSHPEGPVPANDSIPHRLDFSAGGQRSRLEWLQEKTGVTLSHLPQTSLDPNLLKGNIEHFIGMAQVPIGLAGPLLIEGEHAQGTFYVPLATTEGALVASVTRGMMAITRSGGARAKVLDDQVMRAPVFLFERGRQAEDFTVWLEANFDRIKAAAETTTRSGRLKAIECVPNGRRLTVRFLYTSGDASGQNMVTMATHAACTWILKENPVAGMVDHFLENNLSGDKKMSMVNILSARGKKVYADAVVQKDILRHFLHTTPERMVAFWREGALGSMQAGIAGTNAHYANILAAIFIATGQDVACTHEASTGLTVCDLTPSGDLYISVTLPNVIVATVGGGTGKGTQKESLEILGCAGSGKVGRLAEIIAASVLAGEISIAGAHSAGDFAQAHDKLGRNRPQH